MPWPRPWWLAVQATRAGFDQVADLTPLGRTRDGILVAAALPARVHPAHAAKVLGSGSDAAAWDTVPFALWAAFGALDSFEETFWRAVAGLGDRDTTSAIACGIATARLGEAAIPPGWLDATEPLPVWVRPTGKARPSQPGIEDLLALARQSETDHPAWTTGTVWLAADTDVRELNPDMGVRGDGPWQIDRADLIPLTDLALPTPAIG